MDVIGVHLECGDLYCTGDRWLVFTFLGGGHCTITCILLVACPFGGTTSRTPVSPRTGLHICMGDPLGYDFWHCEYLSLGPSLLRVVCALLRNTSRTLCFNLTTTFGRPV